MPIGSSASPMRASPSCATSSWGSASSEAALRPATGLLRRAGRSTRAGGPGLPGGPISHFLATRGGRLVEANTQTKADPARVFARFPREGLLPGLLSLGLGAAVLVLKPAAPG